MCVDELRADIFPPTPAIFRQREAGAAVRNMPSSMRFQEPDMDQVALDSPGAATEPGWDGMRFQVLERPLRTP